MLTIRASELGSCLKAQIAIHLGHKALPTPDRMQAAYDRGNEHEDACAEAMRAQGWSIYGEQTEVVLAVTDDISVPGHLDGFATQISSPRGEEYVWEAKAPGAWQKFHDAYKKDDWSDPLTHRYAWQISTYMIATGLEAMVTCLDGDEVKSFVIEVPPFSQGEITARALSVSACVDTGVLPTSCSQNDYPCPVQYLHIQDEDPPEIIEDPEVVAATEEYERQGAKESSAKAWRKRLRPTLDSAYTHAGKYRAGKALVTVYEADSPPRFSEEAMRADGIDPEKYKTVKKSLRLKVTRDEGV